MDNGHFPVSRDTSSHISSTPLYGHWVPAHCLFSLSYYGLILDIAPRSNNDRFIWVNTTLSAKKTKQNKSINRAEQHNNNSEVERHLLLLLLLF